MTALPEDSQQSEAIASRPIALVSLAAIVLSVLLIAGAYGLLAMRRSSLGASRGLSEPAAPLPQGSNLRLEQFRGPAAGEQLQRRQRGRLASYGWVSRAESIVHIPIDVAIELELEERSR